ncbi:MAG: hypothetical protein IKX95_02205 [Lachnospiraceae bacterium]|nr:hypothetical protein [Lachnospiraceae bacterium]
MDTGTRYVVGYDLNDTLTQISYFELDNDAPKTLVSDGENERLGIPTLLCKRRKVNQWSFGTEAKRLILNEGEAEAGKLLSMAVNESSIMIDGESFEGLDLLILFVRKSLNLLSVYVPMEQIENFIFTVPSLDGDMIKVLERVSAAIPVERERIMFQSYSESVYYYMIHQQAELWETESAVFDHNGKNMTCYHLKMNHRTTPIVGVIDEYTFDNVMVQEPGRVLDEKYDDEEEAVDENNDITGDKDGSEEEGSIAETAGEEIDRMDEALQELLHDFLMSRPIRSAYLLGDGFEGEWCKKTIGFLCMGRRVFQGKNMYSKGACYYGMDKLKPTELNSKYIFLGKDKLQFNLGMNMKRKDKEEYIALADGGENWFDISTVVEFLLTQGSKVDMLVTPLDGKEVRNITVNLDGLPNRPEKTTRLKMRVSFTSGDTLKIRIEDMGFGEIFPSSSLKWEKEVRIV